MKNIILLSFFFPFLLISQNNLVPNSSFELSNNYPLGGSGVIGLQFAPYNTDVFDWYNPNTASPDYYSSVNYPYLQNYTLPGNTGFVGIATYGVNQPVQYTNAREYISCHLLDTLVENDFYFVSFFTRVNFVYTRFASNNLGVHFSDTAMHSNDWFYFDVDAQVKYFNNEIIEDTAQWTLISGIYQAYGGEQFLTLGNFNSDAETAQGMEYLDGQIWQTYFLIDEVSVIPLDSIPGGIPAYAGPDQTIYIQDSVFIGQKISNMPANWFKLDGTPVAQNTAGVYVSPLETTTYVVTQTLNGVYSTDTVTIFVIGLGLEEEKMPSLRVYPNPSSGRITLQCDKQNLAKSEINILDVTGKIVYTDNLSFSAGKITVEPNLLNGVYWLTVSQDNKILYQERLTILK